MLQHTRTGDGAFLGDVADEKDRRRALLGELHEARGAVSDLRDASGRRLQRVGVHGLNGIDDHHRRLLAGGEGKNLLHLRFGEQPQSLDGQAQALRAQRDLAQGLLAGDIERALPAIFRVGRECLQQQGGFTDSGIAADEHNRTRHYTPAKRPVELTNPERLVAFCLGGHLVGVDDARRRLSDAAQSPGEGLAPGRWRCALQQRVPFSAVGALATPFGGLSPAGLALVDQLFPHFHTPPVSRGFPAVTVSDG